MCDQSNYTRMAEVDDSSSYEDDNKVNEEPEDKDNNSTCSAVVLDSNPDVVAPLPVHVNFYDNAIGESSGSTSMVAVPMDSDASVNNTDKFFQSNHDVGHSFRSAHSNNPLVISALETEDSPFHQVIELKEDETCDSRPTRGLMLYSCHFPHCGFQSPDRDGLTDHIVSFHKERSSKPKEFQCDMCQMKFTMLANMQRHRMSHLGVRPYECRICNKKFTRNDHLMEHLVRQHSKQRPYKCPFCVKSYSMKPSLKAHLASDHSGIPKDKVCRVCGFRATTVAGAKIHYTNTHLRNGATTPSTSKTPIQNMEDGVVTPSTELMEEMDLARVSQNFSFNTQENVSVPTSTASFTSETSLNNNANTGSQPEHQQSFRRYQASSSFLPLPLCSSTLSGPIIDPAFPGTSTMTDVSSSMREKTVVFSQNCDNGNSEVPFLCSSSNLKQEPIEIDDGHNSCSSSAGAQPTSTMDTTETNGPEDSDRQTLSANNGTGDEEDVEVGNHFATQLRNAKTNNSNDSISEMSGRRIHSSEDDVANKSEQGRIEHKPEINSITFARGSKYEKRRNIDRKPCHRPHCCDAGDSKVSTSVCTIPVSASNSSSDNARRDIPDAKPLLACLHRKSSTCSTVAIEQNSGLSREATEPAPTECNYCGIIFPDRTLYYLHRGMHSDSNPWKCNMCGELCDGKYDFYAHMISREHR